MKEPRAGRRPRVLVVDAANVVGSRPDGWWRDRAGAARRLHDALVDAALPWDRVVLVLEGRARAGVREGAWGRVQTIHAAGSGDDELVARCRAEVAGVAASAAAEGEASAAASVTLVTADRGLLARVAGLGVATLGPSALLGLLDGARPAES